MERQTRRVRRLVVVAAGTAIVGPLATVLLQARIARSDPASPLACQHPSLYCFVAGAPAQASQVNSNFEAVSEGIDAKVDRAPIAQATASADRTSLTVTGLQLDTDQHYTLLVKLTNPQSANFVYELYFNSDTTKTNYYSTLTQVPGGVNQFANSVLFNAGSRSFHVMRLDIEKSSSGRVVAYGRGGFETTPYNVSNVQLWTSFIASSTTTGLTSLTVTSAATGNGIGAGSSLAVYKN